MHSLECSAFRHMAYNNLSSHAGVRQEFLEDARRTISYHAQGRRQIETNFITTNDATKLIFGNDLRLKHVKRWLDSSLPIEVPVEPLDDSMPSEFELQRRDRVKEFLFCCIYRQLALSIGRGMLTFRTESSLSIDLGRLRKLCLVGVEVDSEKIVDLRTSDFIQKLDTKWARFHNGVAAALAHAPAFSQKSNSVTDADLSFNGKCRPKRRVVALDNNLWLTRIMSHGFPSPTPGSLAEQGGFIFGMGLNGNISPDADRVDFHDFLVRVDERMSAGALLGLAASRIGSQDPSIIGLLAIHLDALLPEEQHSYEFVVPHNVRAVAITALGLLYQGACDRYVVERVMSELMRPTEPEAEASSTSSTAPTSHAAPIDRESLNFCAGIALGNVLLGKMHRNASYGLGDLNLTQRLLIGMRGGPLQNAQAMQSIRDQRRLVRHAGRSSKCTYEKNFINTSVTSVGATIALGLMYLKTENVSVADALKAPDSESELARTRPDFWFWRILARNLILWNSIEPTDVWLLSNVPLFLQNASVFHVHAFSRYNQTAAKACSRLDRQYSDLCLCFTSHAYMLLGALFALALKYAGSCNLDADLLISKHLAIYFRYTVKESPIDPSIMQQAEQLSGSFVADLRKSVTNMQKSAKTGEEMDTAVTSDKSGDLASHAKVDSDNFTDEPQHSPTILPEIFEQKQNSTAIGGDRNSDDTVSIPETEIDAYTESGAAADSSPHEQDVIRRFPNDPSLSAAIREPTRRRGNTYRDLVEEILDARFSTDYADDDERSLPPTLDERYEPARLDAPNVAAVDADEIALAESTMRALLLPPVSPTTSASPRQSSQQPISQPSTTSPPLQRYRRTNLSDEDIADAALSSGNFDLLNELLLPSAPTSSAASAEQQQRQPEPTTTASSFFSSELPAANRAANVEPLSSSFRLLATPYGVPSATQADLPVRSNNLGNGNASASSTPPFASQQHHSQPHLANVSRTFRRNLAYCFRNSRTFPVPGESKAPPPPPPSGSAVAESYDIVHDDIQRVLAYESFKEPFITHCIGNANLNSLMLNCLMAKSVVMAGSGDLDTIRYCRRLLAHTEPVYGNSRDELRISDSSPAGHHRYGMYMAASMALGFVTLGCGRYTLSSSNAAIAALITSLSPYWPRDPNDNKHHLQMLRHMYVLAVECRMLIPRALGAGLEFIELDCVVRNADDTFTRLRAPIMIAELPRVRQLFLERGGFAGSKRMQNIVFDRNDKVSWQTLCRLLDNGGEILLEADRNQLQVQRKRRTNIETVKRTPYEVSLGLRQIGANTNSELIAVADRQRLRAENAFLSILKRMQMLELLLWMPHDWKCTIAQRTWHALFHMQGNVREQVSVDCAADLPEPPLRNGVVLQPRKYAYLVELYADSCSPYKKLLERMDAFDVYWRFVYHKQRQRRVRRKRQMWFEQNAENLANGGRDEVDGRVAEEHLPPMDEFEVGDQLMLLISAADRREVFETLGTGNTPASAAKPARRSSILARRPLKRRKSSLPSVLDGIVEASDEVVTSTVNSSALAEEPLSKRLARANDGAENEGLPFRSRHTPLQRRSSIAGVFPVPKSTLTVRFAPESRRTAKFDSFQTPQRHPKSSIPGTKSGSRMEHLSSARTFALKSSRKSGTKSHLTMSTLASAMKRTLGNSAARQRRRQSMGRSASQPQSFASVEEEEEEEHEREAAQLKRKTATSVDDKISQSDHAFARLRFNPLMSRVLLHDEAKVEAATLIASASRYSDADDDDDEAEIERIRSEIPFGEAFVHEKALSRMQTMANNVVPTPRYNAGSVDGKSLRTSALSANSVDKSDKLADLIDRKLTSLYGKLSTTWTPFEFLVSGAAAAKPTKSDAEALREILAEKSSNAGSAACVTVESLLAKWHQHADGADTRLLLRLASFDSPLSTSTDISAETNSFMESTSSSVEKKFSENSSSVSCCSSGNLLTTTDDIFLAQLSGRASHENGNEAVMAFLQQRMSQVLGM